MPLALSIRCPGELGDELPAIEQLKERLWRKEDCSIETVGWVHGFVVRLRESCLGKVNALLAEHDCVVADAWEEHYEWPSGERPVQQHLAPWNLVPHEREPMSESVRGELQALFVSQPDTYESRIAVFLEELRAILLQRHVDPESLQNVLAAAHEIVDNEDPVTGPHAGIIINLEKYLSERSRCAASHSAVSA